MKWEYDWTDILKKMMINGLRTQRGETQSMGLNLQAGQKANVAFGRSETRAVELKMAAPRAGANELRGSVDCQPHGGNG